MGDSRRHAARQGWWLVPAIIGFVVASAAVAVVVATARVAKLVITPKTDRLEEVTVLGVDREAGTVTLSDHADVMVPGDYGLFFDNDTGHAKVGEILACGNGTVTRRLVAEEDGRLRPGVSARVSGWFYRTPAELGLAWREVDIPTPLGPAPAWLVPVTPSGKWVILVHGRGPDRSEAIRAVPAFHAAGYTSLLISYRNDGVASPSIDGRYALGDSEWEDVDAAIRFAVRGGATDIVIMGWSMGGAMALQAATRSRLAGYLRGVILDSPVIDWVDVLNHQAGSMGIPRPLRSAALTVVGRAWGRVLTGQTAPINFNRLDFVRRAGELKLPILLMHSESDSYVPAAPSQELARLRPDIVTFESFAGAGHTQLWNYDRERWNSVVTNWLAKLDAVSVR